MSSTAATTPSPSDGDQRKCIEKRTIEHLRSLSSLRAMDSDPEVTDPTSGYDSQWSSQSEGQRLASESMIRALQAKLHFIRRVSHVSPNPPSSPSSDSELKIATETHYEISSDAEYPMALMLANISRIHLSRELQQFRQTHRAQTSGAPSKDAQKQMPTKGLDFWSNSESSSSRSSAYEPSPTQVTFAPQSPSAGQVDQAPSASEHSRSDW